MEEFRNARTLFKTCASEWSKRTVENSIEPLLPHFCLFSSREKILTVSLFIRSKKMRRRNGEEAAWWSWRCFVTTKTKTTMMMMKKNKKARDGSTRRVSYNSPFHCFFFRFKNKEEKMMKLKVQVIHIFNSSHSHTLKSTSILKFPTKTIWDDQQKCFAQTWRKSALSRSHSKGFLFSNAIHQTRFEATAAREKRFQTVIYQSHNGIKTRPRQWKNQHSKVKKFFCFFCVAKVQRFM